MSSADSATTTSAKTVPTIGHPGFILTLAALGLAIIVVTSQPFFQISWMSVTSESFGIGLRFIDAKQSWGKLRFNKAVSGRPLQLGGKVFRTGLGTHADSVINLSVVSGATKLSGMCGVNDGANGSIICKIYNGERLVFESPLLVAKDGGKSFEVEIEPDAGLRLVIDHHDNLRGDHASWVALEAHK